MALHEVQLKGYSVRPGNLSLGTFDSYGIEQLHVTLDDMWSGLAVTATFNPPKGEPVEIRVPENGLIDVPAEATANEGTGAIVYCGVANGVQLITKTQGYNVITHGNVGGTAPFNPSESLATQVLQAALNAEKNSAEANTAAQSAQTAAENAAAAAQARRKQRPNLPKRMPPPASLLPQTVPHKRIKARMLLQRVQRLPRPVKMQLQRARQMPTTLPTASMSP